jgi:Tol biopolymer transport system component
MVVALSAVPNFSGRATFPGANGRLVISYYRHLVTMDPDGSNATVILEVSTDQLSSFYDLEWAPDGTQIAFRRCCRFREQGDIGFISVVGSDGTGLTRVTTGNFDDAHPSWSPDGTQLVFDRFDADLDWALWLVNPDGTGLSRLTDVFEPRAIEPAWAPNGGEIAFIERLFGDRTLDSRLVVMDEQAVTFRFLTSWKSQLRDPSWSPDGSMILFERWNRGLDKDDLWSIAADGTGLTRLTSTAHRIEQEPAFSPDGTRIVFIRSKRNGGSADLVFADPDGSNQDRLVTTPDERSVSWQAT